jgi:hypothetical protein
LLAVFDSTHGDSLPFVWRRALGQTLTPISHHKKRPLSMLFLPS